jgi:hypothetical protein
MVSEIGITLLSIGGRMVVLDLRHRGFTCMLDACYGLKGEVRNLIGEYSCEEEKEDEECKKGKRQSEEERKKGQKKRGK